MKYRVLAADMDGTILRDDKSISEETIRAVREFREAGGFFIIASGRPLPAMTGYLKDLAPNAPLVTYNGAKIVDHRDGRVLFEEGMLDEDAILLMKEGEKRGHTVIVWSDDILYGNELNENMRIYVEHTDIIPYKYESPEAFRGRSVTKIILNDEPAKIALTRMDAESMGLKSTSWATSGTEYLEFYSSKVSKAVSVGKAAAMVGCDASQIVAVGDGCNDIPMIRFAGLGVAMGNAAPEEVKEAADYVTDTNMNDGVAKLIREKIL